MGVATWYINIFKTTPTQLFYTHAVYRRRSVHTTKNKRQRWHTSGCRLPYIPSNFSPKISATSSSSAFSFARDVLLRRLYRPTEYVFDPLEDASKTRTSVIKSSSDLWLLQGAAEKRVCFAKVPIFGGHLAV